MALLLSNFFCAGAGDYSEAACLAAIFYAATFMGGTALTLAWALPLCLKVKRIRISRNWAGISPRKNILHWPVWPSALTYPYHPPAFYDPAKSAIL